MKARFIASFAALLIGAVSALCFTNLAGAQTYTWDSNQTGHGSDGPGTWDSGSNWASGGVDAAWSDGNGGNTAVFGCGSGAAGTVTIGQVVAPAGITFNPAQSGNYVVSGGSINLVNAGTPITANADATISSYLLGSGGLVKMGSGTLTLAGYSYYNGATVVNGGTLKLAGPPTGLGYFLITSDSDSGISTNNTYTHAINPSGGGFSINGVPFTGATSGTLAANSLAPQSYAQGENTAVIGNSIGVSDFGDTSLTNNLGGWSGVTGNLLNLYSNFNWNTPNPRTVVLTGLQPNTAYDLVLYEKQWSDATGRQFSIGYDVGDTGTPQFTSPTIDQNEPQQSPQLAALSIAQSNAWGMSYVYRTGPGQTSIALDVNSPNIANDYTYHFYGLTNQVVSVLPPATPLTIAAGSTLDLGGVTQQVASLSDYAPGSGGSVVNSNTGTLSVLSLNPTGSTTFSGTIQGGGTLGTVSLVIVGSGTQVLAGSNTYTGATTISSGILNLAHPLAVQNSTVTVSSGGSLTFAAGVTSPILGGLAGAGGLSLATAAAEPVTLNVGQNGQNTTYSGNLSGAGGLTKTGSGTLTLASYSTYNGATVVNGGTLKLQPASAGLGLTNQTFTNDVNALIGSTSPFGSGGYTVALAFNQSGSPGGSNLDINGVTFQDTGTAASGADWAVTGLPSTSSGSFPGDFPLVANQATYRLLNHFYYGNGAGYPETLTISGLKPGESYDARLYYRSFGEPNNNRSANFTFDPGAGSPATRNDLNEDGDSAAHYLDYEYVAGSAGTMTISISPLTAASWHVYGFSNQLIPVLPAATPLTIAAGSTLDLGGVNQQVASLSDYAPGSGGSVVSSNTGTVSVLSLSPTGSTTFSGTIQGGGTLGTISLAIVGSGTQVLAGSNTFTGATTISSGILNLAHPLAVQNSTVTVGSGGSLTFAAGVTSPVLGGLAGAGGLSLATAAAEPVTLNVGQNGQNTTFSGNLSGAGGLTKTGSGTLTVAGCSTYSGATVVNGGTLKLQPASTGLGVTNQTFTTDANAGIGSTSPFGPGNYTVALAFNQSGSPGGSNVDINGVTFQDTGRSTAGTDWAVSGLPDNGASGNFPAGFPLAGNQGTYQLLNHFYYGNGVGNPETMTISGLTPGQSYDARLYYRDWNTVGDDRAANFTFDPGTGSPTTLNNLNEDGDANAHYLNYEYVAGSAGTMAITISPLTGSSWHVYGFSNQLIPILPTATPLTIAAGSTLDLGGVNQQVASLSDYSPGSGGSIINSNTAAASVLTLSASGGSTTFSGQIAGGGSNGIIGLLLAGSGTLVLAGSDTYTGGTDVEGGTLVAMNSNAIPYGSALTVGTYGTVVFGDPAGVGTPTVATSPAGRVEAVPEPGTWVLLAVALWSAAACYRFSKRPVSRQTDRCAL